MFKNILNKVKSYLINNYKNIALIVLSVLTLALSFTTCSTINSLSKKEKDNLNLRLALQQTDSIKNKYGETINVQEVQATNDKNYIKELTDSIFNLKHKQDKQIKAVIAYYQSRTNIRIDSFETAWVDTAKMKHFADSVEQKCADVIKYYRDSTAPVGRVFTGSNEYLTVTSFLKSPTNLTISKIEMIDTLDIRVSELKGGLFKRNQKGKLKFLLKKSYRIEVKHSNKYFLNTGNTSIIYVPKNNYPLLKGVLIGAAGAFTAIKVL